MKNIIIFIAFIGLTLSTSAQDVLKLKTIKTYYGDTKGGSFYRIGDLDGAVLNVDTLSSFFPEWDVINISNDTFSSDVGYQSLMKLFFYADTGLLFEDYSDSPKAPLGRTLFPNDAMTFAMGFNFSNLIDYLKEDAGIELEQISYWKMISGIQYTSKDGYYSEDVFYAGADTVTFRVVRGDVGVQEIEQKASVVSVYPNPAATQLHVERNNYPSLQTDYVIYNIMGQTVLQGKLQESAIINIESLAKGMYYLRISNATVKFVKN